MADPILQTRLSVLSGSTSEPRMTFVWGQTVSAISVGARAQWVISGAGVLDVHFFISFDGRQLYVAAAVPNACVEVGHQTIGQQWTVVPAPAEIAFGAARVSVVCETRTSSAPPPGVSHTPTGVRVTHTGTAMLASPSEAAQLRAQAQPDAVEPQRDITRRPSEPPAAVTPMRVVAATIGQLPQSRGDRGAPLETPVETPWQAQTLPMGTYGEAHVLDTGPHAVPARVEPTSVETHCDPVHVPPEEDFEGVPSSTLADGGRLRAYAEQINEYFAEEARRQASEAPPAVKQPEQLAPGTPTAPPLAITDKSAGPSKSTGSDSKTQSSFMKAWRETSSVKKIILALLPLAAAAALLDPLAPPPPKVSKAKSAASAAAKARLAAPSASSIASASPSPTTSAAAEPVASAAPSTLASGAVASGAPAATPSTSAPVSVPVSTAGSSALPAVSARADIRSELPRLAIDAAFNGRHREASEYYAQLARERPQEPVYDLASRFAKEGAVRKP